MTITENIEVVDTIPRGSVRTVRVSGPDDLPVERKSQLTLSAIRDEANWALLLPPAPAGSAYGYGWELDPVLRRWPDLETLLGGKNLRGYWVSDGQVEVLSDVWTLPTEPEEELIAGLRRSLEDMTQDRDSTQTRLAQVQRDLINARAQHQQDIDVIGVALIEEAEDRDWCETYDSVIDGINSRLHIELPIRERSWTVQMDVTIRVSVNVKARTVEAAEEEAGEHDMQSLVYNLQRYEINVHDHEVVGAELA